MNKRKSKRPLLTVVKFELIRQIKKPSFWISILLVPATMAIVFAISYFSGRAIGSGVDNPAEDDVSIAITDQAGILSPDAPYIINGDKDYGIEKLKNGEIDQYFYIPADFAESKKIDHYYISDGIEFLNLNSEIIKNILAQSALQKLDATDAMILTDGYEVEENALNVDGSSSNLLGKAIIPIAILLVFFLLFCTFGNRFLMTAVEEKENRISEMILTSVSAKHLIIGKIIAMLLLSIIMVLALTVPVVVFFFVYRDNPLMSGIADIIELDPLMITMSLCLFVFSVVFFVGACTFVGTLTSTARDASSFMAPLIIGIALPFYFLGGFLTADPEMHTVIEVITFFPFSAPTALMLRNALGTLTTPEYIIGLVELITVAVLSVWLSIRTFQRNSVNFETVKPKLLRKHYKK